MRIFRNNNQQLALEKDAQRLYSWCYSVLGSLFLLLIIMVYDTIKFNGDLEKATQLSQVAEAHFKTNILVPNNHHEIQNQGLQFAFSLSNVKTLNYIPDTKNEQENYANKNSVNAVTEQTVTLNIPEGANVYQLCEYFEKNKTPITKREFLDALKNRDFYDKLANKYSILPKDVDSHVRFLFEGYLLGGKYEVTTNSTAGSLIEQMVANMDSYLKKLDTEANLPVNKSYTYSELIALASVIEKESDDSSDRKGIAGVFYNRLNNGQKLQSDVTVLYALGVKNRRVLYRDLEVSSLYNTYYVDGLPIGPVASPSRSSLDATFSPKSHNYYFFVGVGAKTIFTSTFEEHKKVINKYL